MVCAFFENLGDAGGYLSKKSWQQFLVAVMAMAIYGAVTVVIARGGWRFTEAFPIWYIFAYKLTGWTFAYYLEGSRITRYDVMAGVLIFVALVVNVVGQLRRI